MMDCDFDNDGTTCPRCGFKAGARDWRKNCKGKPRLGDRIKKVAEAVGFKKQCGGCKKRQSKANALPDPIEVVKGWIWPNPPTPAPTAPASPPETEGPAVDGEPRT